LSDAVGKLLVKERGMETNNKRNTKAIVSLIISCVSVINCCVWYLAIILGAVGIVLGILALREENKRQSDLAIAGIVVGGVGVSLGIVIAVLYIMMFTMTGSGTTTTPDIQDSAENVMMAIRNRILR
jgi:hypothetical protein